MLSFSPRERRPVYSTHHHSTGLSSSGSLDFPLNNYSYEQLNNAKNRENSAGMGGIVGGGGNSNNGNGGGGGSVGVQQQQHSSKASLLCATNNNGLLFSGMGGSVGNLGGVGSVGGGNGNAGGGIRDLRHLHQSHVLHLQTIGNMNHHHHQQQQLQHHQNNINGNHHHQHMQHQHLQHHQQHINQQNILISDRHHNHHQQQQQQHNHHHHQLDNQALLDNTHILSEKNALEKSLLQPKKPNTLFNALSWKRLSQSHDKKKNKNEHIINTKASKAAGTMSSSGVNQTAAAVAAVAASTVTVTSNVAASAVTGLQTTSTSTLVTATTTAMYRPPLVDAIHPLLVDKNKNIQNQQQQQLQQLHHQHQQQQQLLQTQQVYFTPGAPKTLLALDLVRANNTNNAQQTDKLASKLPLSLPLPPMPQQQMQQLQQMQQHQLGVQLNPRKTIIQVNNRCANHFLETFISQIHAM